MHKWRYIISEMLQNLFRNETGRFCNTSKKDINKFYIRYGKTILECFLRVITQVNLYWYLTKSQNSLLSSGRIKGGFSILHIFNS